jgi:hypothetical protein
VTGYFVIVDRSSIKHKRKVLFLTVFLDVSIVLLSLFFFVPLLPNSSGCLIYEADSVGPCRRASSIRVEC